MSTSQPKRSAVKSWAGCIVVVAVVGGIIFLLAGGLNLFRKTPDSDVGAQERTEDVKREPYVSCTYYAAADGTTYVGLREENLSEGQEQPRFRLLWLVGPRHVEVVIPESLHAAILEGDDLVQYAFGLLGEAHPDSSGGFYFTEREVRSASPRARESAIVWYVKDGTVSEVKGARGDFAAADSRGGVYFRDRNHFFYLKAGIATEVKHVAREDIGPEEHRRTSETAFWQVLRTYGQTAYEVGQERGYDEGYDAGREAARDAD